MDDNEFLGVLSAANGERGSDQQRIAMEGLRWLDLLLRKNRDYGCAVWQSPVLCPDMPAAAAILVRMSDKVNRLSTLSNSVAQVDESFDDTMRDLGAYALLYLARPIPTPKGAKL